jgi:hypothetical protein
MRIGYLSSAAGSMAVTINGASHQVDVLRGPNSVYLQVSGSISSVTLGGLSEGMGMCVDTVEVGQPVPGGPL